MKKIVLLIILISCVTISRAQLLEDFEGDTFPPEGWLVTSVSNFPGNNWTRIGPSLPQFVFNGNYAGFVNGRENIGSGNTAEKWLISLPMIVNENSILSFWSRSTINGFQNTTYQVRILANGNQDDLAEYEILAEYIDNEEPLFYVNKSISLEEYEGQTVHIAFVIVVNQPTAAPTGERWIIDDISFENVSLPNTINVIPFLDSNSNGFKDESEPNFLNGNLNYQLNNTGDTAYLTSNNGVFYVFPENETDVYDFTYSIYSEFAGFYSEPISFDDVVYSQTESNVYYIPIINTTPYNDVTVSFMASNQPAAGFNYINKIYYSNNGIAPESGTLSFEKDPALTINNISVAGTTNIPTGFTFDYTDLMPFETRSITVTMSVPPIPTVAIGDLVTNSVSITSLTNDIDPNNNEDSINRNIVASYDPNDKNESHGNKIALADFTEDDYLYYTIRFQNTGTTNATFVRVEDVLDAQLNPESLRMIAASHPYVLERINNELVWKFDNIQLVPQIVNENASIGFVHFKIKPNSGIVVGDIIPNTADIYFDFNPVIVTNTFETEFVETLSTPDFTNSTIVISPNPTKDRLQIQLNGSDSIEQISVYDVVGKRVYFRNKLELNATTVDFSNLHQGVYMVEVITASNQKLVNKIIKQ